MWWDLPLSESFTILKEIYNVSDADYKDRMKFLDDVLQLSEFFDRPVRTLSLGQRMRADLGEALLHNPKVLYLDEPTIGLDLVVKDNIRAAIKEINEKYNTTVILTTHDIGDIEELCSRIIIIDAGKKIYDGSLEQLKDTYGTKRKVSMEVKQPKALESYELYKVLGVKPEECNTDMDFQKNFDRYMLRPMNIFFQVISEKLQPDAIGELLVGTILIVRSLMKGIVVVDFVHILMFFVSIIAGALIYTAVKLFFASWAFWVKISGPFLQVAYEMADFAKYPTQIYAKLVRFIITWIIPFAFVAYLSASYFLGVGGHPGDMAGSIAVIGVEWIIAVVFCVIAYALFSKGTKIYESAGN